MKRFLHNLKGGKAMINKNWAFALGILSLSTAMVAADQTQQMDKNPPMPMGVTSQPTGVITPPVAPTVQNGADVFLTADFIYWKVNQHGLGYANTAYKPTADTTYSQVVQGAKTYHAGSKYDPGFKVGLGLQFEHDGWDLYAQYTWLANGKDTDSVSNNTSSKYLWAESGYIALNANGQRAVALEHAKGEYQTNFNVIDLEMGRNFFVSRYMTLRPHFGLKGSFNHSKFHQYYTFDNALNTTAGTSGTPFVTYWPAAFKFEDVKSDFRAYGIGIRAGLDPVWHFTRSWGMYGKLAVTAQYTYNRTQNIDMAYLAASNGTKNYASGTQLARANRVSSHNIVPIIELGLGLTYMTWFYDESYMFDIKAGWEEQVWINYGEYLNATHTDGNLSLQGFTLKFGFHF